MNAEIHINAIVSFIELIHETFQFFSLLYLP